MKHLHFTYALLSIVIGLISQACDSNLADEPDKHEADSFNLTVNIPLAAPQASDDGLNEFKVRSLHLFFFSSDNHDDATSQYLYDAEVEGEFEFSRQLRIALPDNALEAGGLFGPQSDTCIVYAVANVDEDNLNHKTISGLKSTPIGSDFDKTRPQQSFAMDGLATLTLDRSNRSVSGTIELHRAAAKLTLSVNLPQSIDVEQNIMNPIDGTVTTETITYFSRPDGMHAWITNGVKESELNTAPVNVSEEKLYSNEIYAADGVGSPFTFDASQAKYSYIQNIPFYSYPNKWDSYSPKGNCFITLEIPWYYTDGAGLTRNVVTYYRLNVQPGNNQIERDTHYDMRVTIGRLGGTTVQQPVDMLFDWNYNMQWNVQTLPTDIKKIRYLLLNNNDYSHELDAYSYTMENEALISIAFNTSHPVEIESVTMSWRDYRDNTDRNISLTPSAGNYRYSDCDNYSPASDFAGIEINAANSTLNLKRDIRHIAWENNSPVISDETAINAYYFHISLSHIDATPGDPSAHASVIIAQIPAINISTQLTASGTRFINNQNTIYNSGRNYYGYITTTNSWPNTATRQRFWLGSYHNSNSYVQNKHTYVLTVSKFAATDDYIIADPRTREVDNLNEEGTSQSSPATWSVSDNNRQLNNYYPADRDAAKSRFFAPCIRIASQWGVTYQISRTAAERRCASYQEDGRPAGRWRLPTAAEIEYICRLSNKQYIPYLFGSEGGTANYWCASGGIDVDNNASNPSVSIVYTTSSERRAVRCVYDEWFWTTDTLTNKTIFKWGDRPRSVSGN